MNAYGGASDTSSLVWRWTKRLSVQRHQGRRQPEIFALSRLHTPFRLAQFADSVAEDSIATDAPAMLAVLFGLSLTTA
jgi:hypothetical protein